MIRRTCFLGTGDRSVHMVVAIVLLVLVVTGTACESEQTESVATPNVEPTVSVTVREFAFEANGDKAVLSVISAGDLGVLEIGFGEDKFDLMGWNLADGSGYDTMLMIVTEEGEEAPDLSMRDMYFGERYSKGHTFFGNVVDAEGFWMRMLGGFDLGFLVRWPALAMTYESEREIMISEGDKRLRISAKFDGEDFDRRTLTELRLEQDMGDGEVIISTLRFLGESSSEELVSRFEFPENEDDRWLDVNSFEEMPDPRTGG
ncbi:MAG: hypothetical protein IH944_03620 [Armatimonadetes bacterium]|nr:hypothetical protein [Armatimonadota bacterium]